MTEREAYIALNMTDKIGPVRVRALIEALGSPQAVFAADRAQLLAVKGIGEDLAESILNQRATVDPSAEEEKARALGARIITPVDAEYPETLSKIYDPPLALYVRGTLEKTDRHAIAMVGTRHATHYGLSVADKLSYQLGKVGFTVISGLARGIDTAAHRGALKAGGRTIAIIGSALDRLYPPENEKLAEEIVQHGAVISEYTLGREPDRTTFPYRNRVISGLSMGVVVVEAGATSGALHTVDQALEQGRTVFAVPGRVDNPTSKGPHRLIKNGARLVEDVDDILQEFEFLIPPEKKDAADKLDSRPAVVLSDLEQKIVRALWEEPLDVDSLARRSGLKSHEVSSLLIGLEMKRIVRMLPGRLVELAEGLRRE
ncbi:MAG TPA: DNA-processing protein DprA [Kiritimatiellia bacterium]|nr:DNA-processing protein DprA [Kiritimatiellia bacterium]HSA19267.1 DNA-processing protein DprA [Kiritimatiellia bacterium]